MRIIIDIILGLFGISCYILYLIFKFLVSNWKIVLLILAALFILNIFLTLINYVKSLIHRRKYNKIKKEFLYFFDDMGAATLQEMMRVLSRDNKSKNLSTYVVEIFDELLHKNYVHKSCIKISDRVEILYVSSTKNSGSNLIRKEISLD